MSKSICLYITNKIDRKWLLQNLNKLLKDHLDITNKEVALFSNSTLVNYINEEIKHDDNRLQDGGTKLSEMSEGEQKMKLLQYLVNQKPDVLILENLLDNLDNSTQNNIVDYVASLASTIQLIQISTRKLDILSFVKDVYTVSNNALKEYKPKRINISQQKILVPSPPEKNYPDYSTIAKLNDVSVTYERPVLNGIYWVIKKNDFWQLKGPNGSGKSTLLTMISGDNPKAYGQDIILFDRQKGSGESVWSIKKNIGYFTINMVRNYAKRDSVLRMVLSGFFDSVGLYQQPRRSHIHFAKQWLEITNLGEYSNTPFIKLNEGQKRLVMVIRALVKHPPLVILDEPSVGLDDEEAQLLNRLINAYAQQSSSAIIYVSHRKEEGLEPEKIYELIPSLNGSVGKEV